jgi:hypothetical protein
VKSVKEEIYIYNSVEQIEEKMEYIMSSTEDLEIFYLKRLLRNTKYLFPATLEEIDPSSIREALLSSKTQAKGVNNNNAF